MPPILRLMPSERAIRVERGTNLLEAVLEAGLPMASACSAVGKCARCGVRILEGAEGLPEETEAEAAAKARNRIDEELRLACRIEIEDDLAITAPYW